MSRTPPVRKQARMQRVREYFYGVRGDLSPHSQTVRLDDLRIYRIGGGPRAPTSALPIGTDPTLNECFLGVGEHPAEHASSFALLKHGAPYIMQKQIAQHLLAGASSVADPIRVTPVSASLDLMHSMLAVSHAATPDQLLSVNVAGFVLITDVDIVQRTITYLAPCPGSLPGRYLIAGSFKVFLE